MHILEILNITKGTLINKINLNVNINTFKINSKEIKNGDCYIALIGSKDGHQYIKEAIKNGASLIIVSKKVAYNIPTILVQNTVKILGNIASYIRQKYNPKIIAITGSVGKTTTRQLIYTVLSTKYKCLQSQKNYNNHIGVPLTIFNLNQDDEIAIIEMGMNHLNEIKYLSKMLTPDIAVITNIGTSHIGNLGSQENILKAKLEIKEGLNGPLFVNGDDPLLKNQKAYKSGFNKENDLIAYDLSSSLNKSSFKIKLKNNEYQITLNLPKHLVNDALIAIHIGLYLKISPNEIIKAIKQYQSYNMRMNILKDSNNNTIINDCYNSSLESLKGVLNLLENEKQKKLLILGDINELGIYTNQIHCQIPKLLDKISNKKVLLIGNYIKNIKYKNALYFSNYKETISYLKKQKIKDTLILIKASRTLKLEQITNYFTNTHTSFSEKTS